MFCVRYQLISAISNMAKGKGGICTVFSFDNKVFRVNGSNTETLKAALSLVMMSEYDGEVKHPKSVSKSAKGLVFHWYVGDNQPALVPLTLDVVFEMSKAYLSETKPSDVELGDWEGGADHDGSNSHGWMVYTEDWGRIEGMGAGFAVKPVCLWYGK